MRNKGSRASQLTNQRVRASIVTRSVAGHLCRHRADRLRCRQNPAAARLGNDQTHGRKKMEKHKTQKQFLNSMTKDWHSFATSAIVVEANAVPGSIAPQSLVQKLANFGEHIRPRPAVFKPVLEIFEFMIGHRLTGCF